MIQHFLPLFAKVPKECAHSILSACRRMSRIPATPLIRCIFKCVQLFPAGGIGNDIPVPVILQRIQYLLPGLPLFSINDASTFFRLADFQSKQIPLIMSGLHEKAAHDGRRRRQDQILHIIFLQKFHCFFDIFRGKLHSRIHIRFQAPPL